MATKIIKKTIADEVFDRLSKKIISGEWPTNYRLPTEMEIADTYGVSRVSVRAAIQKLQMYGMVKTKAGEGTFVNEVSMHELFDQLFKINALPNDYIQMNQMKAGLEQAAVEFIISSGEAVPEAKLDELDALVSDLKNYRLAGDLENYLDSDMQFHREVVDLSQNALLIMIYDALANTIRKISALNVKLSSLDVTESAELLYVYHHMVAEAIRKADKELASRLFYKYSTDVMNSKRNVDMTLYDENGDLLEEPAGH